jgi:hypothetical protein
MDRWDITIAQMKGSTCQIDEPVLLEDVNQIVNNRDGMQNITEITKHINMKGLCNQDTCITIWVTQATRTFKFMSTTKLIRTEYRTMVGEESDYNSKRKL